MATLGQPIFEPLTNAPTARGEKELFYCRGSGADGVGEYTSEGFVVLKGSRGRVENVASIQGTSNQRFRDQLFASPSMAAMALMGRSANGWVEWKAANGRTLDELKRQAVQAAG